MGNKFFALNLFFCILFTVSVFGKLDVTADVLDNSFYPDEYATYKLTIHNTDSFEKVIQIYSTDIQYYSELEPFLTNIGPNETLVTELRLIPSAWADLGPKSVNVMVESSANDEKISMQVPLYLKSYDQVEKQYTPSVEMKVDFPEIVDPRQEIPISLYFRNRNKLDITEMYLEINSQAFKEAKILAIEPMSERTEIVNYKIDLLTPPQEDKLEISIRVNNQTINRERFTYKIISYSDYVTKQDSVEELFKKTTEYVITNNGNVKSTAPYVLPVSLLKKFFVGSSIPASRYDLKKQTLEWDLSLEPMKETKLELVENYRPVIYMILFGIIITMVYFIYRSPVTIRKEALIVGSSKEGISQLKVLLHIRNRSQDLVEHITITDLIPSIVELVQDSYIGTLAPSKVVRNDIKGTIIKWDLDALEPFEERIISYRLNAKITIVGGLKLPPAKVKFESKKGKERVVRSGAAEVSMGL